MKIKDPMAVFKFSILINKKEIKPSPKTSIIATIVSIMLSLPILNKSSDGRIKYNFFKNDGTIDNYILFDVLKLITKLIIFKPRYL